MKYRILLERRLQLLTRLRAQIVSEHARTQEYMRKGNPLLTTIQSLDIYYVYLAPAYTHTYILLQCLIPITIVRTTSALNPLRLPISGDLSWY